MGIRTRLYDVPGAGIYVFDGAGVCIVFSNECIAPFTLALKPVSNRFGQTTSLGGLQKAVSKVH